MRPLLLSLLLAPALPAAAQTTRVLFIGNSYTAVNDLPNTFRQLALSLGDTVEVAASDPGGYTFQQHASYAPTLSAIAAQPWDFVVLQEQSQLPSFPPAQVAEQVFPFAIQLVDSIRAHNACAQPVLYMTWGRRDGDASNCANWPPVCTYAGMQAQLRESYLSMAVENGAFCAPVGAAWAQVRAAQPTLELYASDGSHPSVAGTYLAANTLHATLFRRSTVGATYTAGLDPATAAVLTSTVSALVLDSMAVWNIGVNDADASFTYDIGPDLWIQFHHGGVGSHAWTFSDGTMAGDPDPLQHFAPGQELHVTHVFTDACGSTDTAYATIPLLPTGIREAAEIRLRVTGADGGLIVHDAANGQRLLLYDTAARRVHEGPLTGGTNAVKAGRGAYVWCITDANGTVQRGKVIVR